MAVAFPQLWQIWLQTLQMFPGGQLRTTGPAPCKPFSLVSAFSHHSNQVWAPWPLLQCPLIGSRRRNRPKTNQSTFTSSEYEVEIDSQPFASAWLLPQGDEHLKVTRLTSAHETKQDNLQKQSMILREAERRASGNAYVGFLAISTFRFPALERSDDPSSWVQWTIPNSYLHILNLLPLLFSWI